MSLLGLTWLVLILAAIPALLFLWNLALYQAPPTSFEIEPVSILIPARNEEASIEACLRAALASKQVDLEVIVLDDHSNDRTARIVKRIARSDARLRLASAPALPAGWCGKQFACFTLAGLANKQMFCFIDADVHLEPDGVARMIAELKRRGAGLVSGFPRQVTVTPLEQLLLPLMHFLLLGFLPLFGMRKFKAPSFGAGCGQIFLATRKAYLGSGGHSAIKNSRHDGVTLPRAFRRAGWMTDICDATPVADCRMYHNAGEVFFGLLKNATEGLASPGRIVPFSLVLLVGQVAPVLVCAMAWYGGYGLELRCLATMAVVVSLLPRLLAAFRFRQPVIASLFHPLAILLLLGIQWYALVRSLFHVPATWKGRSYSTT